MSLSRLKTQRLFRQQCYVNGQWLDASGGNTIDVDNPADGKVVGTVPSLSEQEILKALDGALFFLTYY